MKGFFSWLSIQRCKYRKEKLTDRSVQRTLRNTVVREGQKNREERKEKGGGFWSVAVEARTESVIGGRLLVSAGSRDFAHSYQSHLNRCHSPPSPAFVNPSFLQNGCKATKTIRHAANINFTLQSNTAGTRSGPSSPPLPFSDPLQEFPSRANGLLRADAWCPTLTTPPRVRLMKSAVFRWLPAGGNGTEGMESRGMEWC